MTNTMVTWLSNAILACMVFLASFTKTILKAFGSNTKIKQTNFDALLTLGTVIFIRPQQIFLRPYRIFHNRIKHRSRQKEKK